MPELPEPGLWEAIVIAILLLVILAGNKFPFFVRQALTWAKIIKPSSNGPRA